MWTLVALWATLILLATYALIRVLSILKSLRNVYYYKAFTPPSSATDNVTPRIWANFQRLLHPLGCLSYHDPQFQLPPDLHCLLLLEYACVLLVCDYAADLLQPCEEFSAVEAAVAAAVAMAVTVGVDMSVERVFVRSLNAGNRTRGGEEYMMSGEEGRTVNTAPMEGDISALMPALPTAFLGEDPPSSCFDLFLLLLLMFLAGCSLWGVYMSPSIQTQQIWVHWGIGLALDIPFRIVLAVVFGACGGLTDLCKGYKCFAYQIRWKDLGKYSIAPRKVEAMGLSAQDHRAHIKISSEDHMEVNHIGVNEDHMEVGAENHIEVSDEGHMRGNYTRGNAEHHIKISAKDHIEGSDDGILEVKRTEVSAENHIQVSAEDYIKVSDEDDIKVSDQDHIKVSAEDHINVSDEDHRSHLGEKAEYHMEVSEDRMEVSEDHMEEDYMEGNGGRLERAEIPEEVLYPSSAEVTQRQSLSSSFPSETVLFQQEEAPTTQLLHHIPSRAVTSREAVFPPTEPVPWPAEEESCPPLPRICTPEARCTLPAFDEFPIPPDPDRFSDIEGSVTDLEVPVVQRPRRSASLIEALYGKPGLFGRGGPIATLRQSRSRSPKRPPRSRPLPIILNEEKLPNRPTSPEAAESTRYQTPASPILAHNHPGKVENSPRPAHYSPPTVQFEPGNPLPPIVPDREVYLRGESPEAVGVALRRVRQSKSQPRFRSRIKRLTEDYDSPYQEILWRRLPGEGRKRVLPLDKAWY